MGLGPQVYMTSGASSLASCARSRSTTDPVKPLEPSSVAKTTCAPRSVSARAKPLSLTLRAPNSTRVAAVCCITPNGAAPTPPATAQQVPEGTGKAVPKGPKMATSSPTRAVSKLRVPLPTSLTSKPTRSSLTREK